MIDRLHGWAWSNNFEFGDHIWRTDDGGLTWGEVLFESADLDFKYALDTDTAWATICRPLEEVCQPALIRTLDGGSSWTVLNQNRWLTVSRYRFFSQEDGLLYGSGPAAGTAIYNFFETHDGGVTWEPFQFVSSHRRPLSEIPGQYETCNICGDALYLDFVRMVVVGGNLAQVESGSMPLWITLDRGENWQPQDLALPEGLYEFGWFHPFSPVFVGENFGVLGVRLSPEDRESTAAAFYVTANGGRHWVLRSMVEIPGSVEGYTRLEVASEQDMFFRCGSDLCVTHDGAWTWERLPTNLNFETYSATGSYVQSFTFVDAFTGWALAGREDANPCLWMTIDGGQSWSMLEPIFSP
jgi:hypothetical protein